MVRIPPFAVWVRWGFVVAWMALLFWVSSQSVVPGIPAYPLVDLIIKKTGHIGGYTILMLLLLVALSSQRSTLHAPTRAQCITAFIIGIAYAASDEFHQSFVAGRTSLWTDVAIFDCIGLLIGIVFASRHKLTTTRSPIAWLYWIIFLYTLALAILPNLPYHGKAIQDSSLLLRDTWFLWAFSYFGLLITPMAALMIEDGTRRGMRWPAYVLPYFVIGVIPLSIFMARRPRVEHGPAPTNELQRLLELRLLWLFFAACVVVISIIWLPQGSLPQLLNTLNKNTGFWFMVLDIALNHLIALPLLQADMRRRNATNQTLWLAATLLTGPIGLCLYMAQRPLVNRTASTGQ